MYRNNPSHVLDTCFLCIDDSILNYRDQRYILYMYMFHIYFARKHKAIIQPFSFYYKKAETLFASKCPHIPMFRWQRDDHKLERARTRIAVSLTWMHAYIVCLRRAHTKSYIMHGGHTWGIREHTLALTHPYSSVITHRKRSSYMKTLN